MHDIDGTTLAKAVRAFLDDKSLRLIDLAGALGCSQQAVSRWLAAKGNRVNHKTAERLWPITRAYADYSVDATCDVPDDTTWLAVGLGVHQARVTCAVESASVGLVGNAFVIAIRGRHADGVIDYRATVSDSCRAKALLWDLMAFGLSSPLDLVKLKGQRARFEIRRFALPLELSVDRCVGIMPMDACITPENHIAIGALMALVEGTYDNHR